MSVFREADSSAPLAITPAIDFAIVLSRTLADLNKDPAQLRNVVYQLARIKLEQEVAQRNSRVDPVEMKQLSLALSPRSIVSKPYTRSATIRDCYLAVRAVRPPTARE